MNQKEIQNEQARKNAEPPKIRDPASHPKRRQDKVNGRDQPHHTDVVEALLEITGLYASIHGFETYSRTDLAFKHALTIMEHIERFQELQKRGKLPFKVIPRAKIN